MEKDIDLIFDDLLWQIENFRGLGFDWDHFIDIAEHGKDMSDCEKSEK